MSQRRLTKGVEAREVWERVGYDRVGEQQGWNHWLAENRSSKAKQRRSRKEAECEEKQSAIDEAN